MLKYISTFIALPSYIIVPDIAFIYQSVYCINKQLNSVHCYISHLSTPLEIRVCDGSTCRPVSWGLVYE